MPEECTLNEEKLRELRLILTEIDRRQKEEALRYYKPLLKLVDAHCSLALIVAVFGGNRSGKSELGATDLAIQMTGWVPDSLKDIYPVEKLRPRVDARVIVSDFDHGWYDVLEPKFKRLIPRRCLINGLWDKSWAKGERKLRVYNASEWLRDGVFNTHRTISTLGIMTYNQEEGLHMGPEFDVILCDEQPTEPIWKQSLMRIVDRKGRIMLTMTPETSRGDPTWIYTDIYEKGIPSAKKSPDIDVYTVFTEENPTLDIETINKIVANLTPEEREVRLHGAFLHLAGVCYKEFRTIPDAEGFCHVVSDFELPSHWPRVQVVDPHPRTPWACMWVAVDEGDDWYVYDYVWEPKAELTVEDYARLFAAKEGGHSGKTVYRIADPYMGNQDNLDMVGNSIRRRLEAQGLRYKMSINDPDIRMDALRPALRRSVITNRPRLNVFESCYEPIDQMTHFLWKEWMQPQPGRDMRQERGEKNSHFPACYEYLSVENPTFLGLQSMGNVVRWTG